MMKQVDRLSPSVQDYLKQIYELTRNGEPTSTVDLAGVLKITPASVTNMLQKLSSTQPALVNYRKWYGVTLTPEGERAALRIIRRHRLIELFLVENLGYSWEMVHDEAERLEHVVSPYFEERVAETLGEPRYDPHGDPIPNRELQWEAEAQLIPLISLQPGQTGVVRRLNDQDADLLLFLGEKGIRPGTKLKVLRKNPVDGAQQVAVLESKQDLILGSTISEKIQVDLQE